MATFTLTYAPIAEVIRNEGMIKFKTLAGKLMTQDPSRFRDEKTVEDAIDGYAGCLIFNGDIVKFNKDAKRYAQNFILERDVQAALHSTMPNMEKWVLYPFKTRKNSEFCYLDIPWKEIPKDSDEEKYNMNYPPLCDFMGQGEYACTASCGVEQNVLIKLGIIQP